jgi:hypothetical protein
LCSNRFGEAVELDQYGALINLALISLGEATAGEEPPTTGEDARNSQLGVSVACRGIGDLTNSTATVNGF